MNQLLHNEQKPISWEDPLPRSNSISSTTNTFNSQSVTRKSNNSIISLPQRHQSYNLNTVNNNQETSFYNSPQVLNLNSLINNNHLLNNNTSSSPLNQHLNKSHKKLEHTPSARSTVSSEDSWCPSEDHDNDDISSYNDEDDNLSDRSTSLISAARNSQLRLTFNKAKQHLSFDKWRNNSSTMPSTNSQESPGEPLSRLSRWFSIRRGSHQYDLNSSNNSQNRSGSIEKENDEKFANGKKMPQLQETEEDHSQLDGASPLLSQTRMDRRLTPLALPPAPTNLTQSQNKRRHIISAIVHSENSYVSSLQRLVRDYKKPLEESSPPILNGSKMSVLFHRVPDILQCHTLFRITLTDCIRNWDRDEKIGDVFMGAFSKTNVLDVYSGFINNFSNAMDLAKVETKRKSAFADFLNVKQISAHDRLSFFGLMVKPVQRFPQLILFLQDLLKYTPQGHHDRMSLQMALTQLESLADSLNERKREAEQYQAYKEMLGQISGPFNTRFLGSSDQRHNYLLREDNVTQLEFNQSGLLVKTKPRRLLLANDKIICVSVAPKQSQDFGSTEKLSLKWMYHVNDVEIVDNATSATLNRYITSGLNRGGSLKSNHSGSGNETLSANTSHLAAAQMTNGAENLANEMSNLMHDYNVMSRVNDLVGQLKGEYPEINLNITKNVLNTIQTSIRKKDEEMAWVDSCCLQLIVKQKSGKEETLSFRTDNPNVKKEWITELRLAQLALDTNNSPAWEVGDRDNHQRPLTKMPLFVRMHPVYKSMQHQTEVRCGCYYSMSPESKFQKRATKNRYHLWICSVDGSNSHITILMHQPHQAQAMIKDVTAFSLNDTVITAMDFVRGRISLPDINNAAGCDMDCVWIGTNAKKLIIYGGTNPEQEKQIIQLNLPETPTQILFHVMNESVFVALANGDILMYRKDHELWNLKHYQVIKLENYHIPITSILAINVNVYAANINIAPHILRVTSSNHSPSNNSSPSVYVTALMACKGLLWVGTNVGITLTVPLPRLEGVPIISGNVNISYHAHCGPVTFFLPLITKSANQTMQMQIKAPPSRYCCRRCCSCGLLLSNNNIELIDKNNDDESSKAAAKLEKQRSLEVSPSPGKLKNQLPNSPIVLRRKSNIRESDLSRMSKTLPRGFSGVNAYFNGTNSMRSSSSSGSSQNGSDSGCDVYGLYSDLLFVKEDFDTQMVPNVAMSLHEQVVYDSLRRGNSDPDLAAIPSKVSTLDRRLKMKVGRPRSLDLSNWSVDSRSSSLYTSSGSEESMGVKYRSVSRNSSSASHKFNGTELMNINECDHHHHQHPTIHATSTPTKVVQEDMQEVKETTVSNNNNNNNFSAATLKNNKRKNLKNNYHQQMIDGRRTVLMLMGGRGYVNWRHVFYTPPNGPKSNSHSNGLSGGANIDNKQQAFHLRSNSLTSTINYKMLNSTDANVILWEKKL
ncbi:CLUMA_CG003480, isoform A [Clunio marinus]|uniref:CLUMA_CG003480, isoform A n=1 Tax=Clunio marinus TaxID=568069 RepID=A0A1J1HP44_9DIPT|nr:CLUMA_CG003480, isoform A [Clunio marinus]